MSSDDDNRHSWILDVNSTGEFKAVHAIHLPVRHQNVELLLVELFQGLGSVVSAHCAIALRPQNGAAQARQHLVIVNEKNCFHERHSAYSLTVLPKPILR